MGLLHGAKVRADGNLHHVGKAQGAHGGLELGGRGVLAELAHEGRGHAGHHFLVLAHGVDDLEDLALVGDGGEGAVDQAHAAGDALVVVDLGPAQLVGADGVHAAGGGAGPLDLGDGPVGALVEALAALDALVLIDVAVLVLIEIDGVLGADVHAGMGDAALAAVGDADLLGGAGVAGKGDDVDQGLLEILLVGGSLLDVGADGRLGVRGLQAHTQGQTDPFLHDGPFQKHVVAVVGHLSGNDLVGDHVHPAQVSVLIGQTGHLRKDVAADIVYRAVYSSHVLFSSVFPRAVAFRPGDVICEFFRNLRTYYIGGPLSLQENLAGNSQKRGTFHAFLPPDRKGPVFCPLFQFGFRFPVYTAQR